MAWRKDQSVVEIMSKGIARLCSNILLLYISGVEVGGCMIFLLQHTPKLNACHNKWVTLNN